MALLERFAPTHRLIALVWAVCIGLGFLGVHRFAEQEQTRALRQWEQRLAMVAQGQADEVSGWLAARREAVAAVAENMSVRLYVMTLLDGQAQAESVRAGETFLRNYLVAVAGQLGLLGSPSELETIRANMESPAHAGLALLDKDGAVLVQTRGFPPASAVMPELRNELRMIGPVSGEGGPLLWIGAPLRGVQDDESAEPIGWAVAALPIFPAFDDMLRENRFEGKALSRIIDQATDTVIAPQRLRDSLLTSLQYRPVSLLAADSPGKLVEGKNSEAQFSYAYGVPLEETNWTLVRRITANAALSDVKSRIGWLYIAYWTAAAAISFIVFALWRHVTAERLQGLLSNLQSQEKLLELVANSMPARVLIADAKHRVCYANTQAQTALGLENADLQKKTLLQLFGPAQAEPYTLVNERVLAYNKPETVLREQGSGGAVESAIEVQHIPLADIPSRFTGSGTRGVLMIERDLTDIIRTKQARQMTLNKLIETLVLLIDQRDPHAAHHSAGVALIAGEIAHAMELPATAIETVEIAGQLMNLGKLLVPQELLVSAKPLAADEREFIARSMSLAIDYLGQVPFEGPVVETLKQSYERVDGKGPLGLKEEDILETALILSVANSFVALTSPRAWREAKSIAAAKSVLLEEAGKAYARPVVTALCHYLENLGGEAEWQAFLNARSI